MLFDASSYSMFNFQCSIFDSAIFILLFCMLNLHWLKILDQEVRISNHVVSLLLIMYTEPIFLILYLY